MTDLARIQKSPVFDALTCLTQASITDAYHEDLHFVIEVTVPQGVYRVSLGLDDPSAGFTTTDPDGAIVAEGSYCWGAAAHDVVLESIGC